MSAPRRAAALFVALVAAFGCADPQAQKPIVPTTEPSYPCEICGDPTQYPGRIFRVEAPDAIRAGKPATFTIYVTVGYEKLLICDKPDPKVESPEWGVSADGAGYTLGVMVRAVKRDEAKPCSYIDRSVPPKALVVKKTITFAKPGTYALTVVGYDGIRPLGVTWSPGPGEPGAPPAPKKPNSIEVGS